MRGPGDPGPSRRQTFWQKYGQLAVWGEAHKIKGMDHCDYKTHAHKPELQIWRGDADIVEELDVKTMSIEAIKQKLESVDPLLKFGSEGHDEV